MAFSSALVQEGVSRVSSYISTKLEDNVSNAHLVARLEMALSQLEFSLERTANLPITHISLLRRRKMLKQAYMEGTDLLSKHKLQLLTHEPQERLTDNAVRRAVTHSSFHMLERTFGGARNLSISSLLGLSKEEYLSPSIVQIFERCADCADKFVKDVESGCPLWHDTFRYPLERQLFGGKTLIYSMETGSQFRGITMWPVRVEGRGVEVHLHYIFADSNMPSKDFSFILTLRLNQGTSIAEIAVRSLQFVTESLNLLTSQFKSVSESAMGEITLLSRLQDYTQSCCPPFSYCSQETLVKCNRLLRPDPICCTDNVVSSQPQSSHGVPEPVICIAFSCNISAPEYMLQGSIDEIGSTNGPLLKLVFLFMPHLTARSQVNIVDFDGEEERISGSSSMQHMEELLVSKASHILLCPPARAGGVCCVLLVSTSRGNDIFGEVQARNGMSETNSGSKIWPENCQEKALEKCIRCLKLPII